MASVVLEAGCRSWTDWSFLELVQPENDPDFSALQSTHSLSVQVSPAMQQPAQHWSAVSS